MVRLFLIKLTCGDTSIKKMLYQVAFEVDAAFTVCVVNDREINRINEKENNIVLLNILVI